MLVIKEPPVKDTHETTCYNCGAVIEYTDDDVKNIHNGEGFECPCCHEEIIIKQVDNPIFPDNFYQFGTDEGSVALNNQETQKYIDSIRERLRFLDIGDTTYIGSGDTIVIGLKHEDEEIIYVCKNYYEWCKSYD